MTDLEARVLAGMQKRAALGLSAAKADYLAAMFSLTQEDVKVALRGLHRVGLVGRTTSNSFTPSWYPTTARHERSV